MSAKKGTTICLNDEYSSKGKKGICFLSSCSSDHEIPIYELMKFCEAFDPSNYLMDIEKIRNEVEELITSGSIKRRSVEKFHFLLQEKQVSIDSSDIVDLYKLSSLFESNTLQRALDKYCENNLDNVEFLLRLILEKEEESKSEMKEKFSFKKKTGLPTMENVEEILSKKIEECLRNKLFGQLKIETIYRIIEKSSIEQIDNELLYGFIKQSIEERFLLLLFLKVNKLSDKTFKDLYENFKKLGNEKTRNYCKYLSIDLDYIKQMKDQINKETSKTKALFTENEKLRTQNASLANSITNKEKEYQEQIQQLIKENSEKYQKQIDEINKDKKLKEDKITELINDNQNIIIKLRNAEKENDELKNEIHSFPIDEVIKLFTENKEVINEIEQTNISYFHSKTITILCMCNKKHRSC
ncbi:hypothetical protein M9Y10_004241 [Tritrichomonas musculus]|uniref:Uncharacterized protein n=1 Tax=Tritrichomonas musculus TaxID=1915356 RepID=A0ABR2JRG3_9EUKA